MKFFPQFPRLPLWLGLGCLLVLGVIAVSRICPVRRDQTVGSSLAVEFENYALLPFEDGERSAPSNAAVFIDPDGALFAFEADFGPPENSRAVYVQFAFDPGSIGEIRLEGNDLLLVCRSGEKCVTQERWLELSMPIERDIVDAPLFLDRLAITFTPGSQTVQRWARDSLVQSFQCLGNKPTW
jgi:hypothetical protein